MGPVAGWPAHKSIDESRDLIKNVLNGEESYAICLKENGKPFWGRGIMMEAVREILRHAFEDCGMEKRSGAAIMREISNQNAYRKNAGLYISKELRMRMCRCCMRSGQSV